MKKIGICKSPIAQTIWAGSLLKGKNVFAVGKQDVTMDALSATTEYCIDHQDKNNGQPVCLEDNNFKYIIRVEKVEVAK